MEIKRSGSTLRIADTGYRKAESSADVAVAAEPETAIFGKWKLREVDLKSCGLRVES